MDKEKNHFVLAGSQAKRLSLSILLILSKACHALRVVLVFHDPSVLEEDTRGKQGLRSKPLTWRWNMKTVQITIDEELVQEVDQITRQLQTSRSAFTRKALQEALDRYKRELLEQKHRQGYEKHPVSADEFPHNRAHYHHYPGYTFRSVFIPIRRDAPGLRRKLRPSANSVHK